MKIYLPFRAPLSIFLLSVLLLNFGCSKKSDKPADTKPASPGMGKNTPSRDSSTSAGETMTSGTAVVPQTAPFFSERFLRPDQRLEKRQKRILDVLEKTPATGSLPSVTK